MSGRRSRDKGARVGLEITHALQRHGIAARKFSRMYHSGHDIDVTVGGRTLRLEVKSRATGFRSIYDWIDNCDALIVKADRHEPLVVVRLSLAAELPRARRAVAI